MNFAINNVAIMGAVLGTRYSRTSFKEFVQIIRVSGYRVDLSLTFSSANTRPCNAESEVKPVNIAYEAPVNEWQQIDNNRENYTFWISTFSRGDLSRL